MNVKYNKKTNMLEIEFSFREVKDPNLLGISIRITRSLK
jgi:hypothetical protein